MDPSWLQYADPTHTARDLTVEAASIVGITKSLKAGSLTKPVPFARLKALLDSRSDREILDGLRRVVSMIYQNKPALPYFSSVVKNVANPNIEVKKLVYIYLLHYAESDQDLALLSVNAIQKSLSDPNPQVRALALRTMAGMRVPVISQIVSLAIKKGLGDMSPHVRKAAALAIPKCYALEPNALPQLTDYISALLADKQYFVVGPAVQAFLAICPERLDLIHRHYRSLCRKLVDMDEWSQLATIRLLASYCRQCFPVKHRTETVSTKAGFYDDEPTETTTTDTLSRVIDPDHELLLKSLLPLLHSRSSAIIIAIATTYLAVGTPDYIGQAIPGLVGLLRSPPAVSHLALLNIASIALSHPELFVRYASHFLLSSEDSFEAAHLKLEILTLIFPAAKRHLQALILSELSHFAHSPSFDLVRESVRAIGRCVQSTPTASAQGFKVLLSQIGSFDNVLVSEVLTVMRHLIQQDPNAHRKTIIRLARNLDTTNSGVARATVVWLVGEFAALDENSQPEGVSGGIAADVLRILTKNFATETEEVKGQIILLAAKVYLLHLQCTEKEQRRQSPNGVDDPPDHNANAEQAAVALSSSDRIAMLWQHILTLARYDTSYDLRDRARLFRNLLANAASTQLAALLLLAPKPVPQTPSPSETRRGLMLGTATLALGKEVTGGAMVGYEDFTLPDWVDEGQEPDARLRDGEDGVVTNMAGDKPSASSMLEARVKEQGLEKVVKAKGISKGRGDMNLDDWLDEEEDGETETESEQSEEETESEEETGSEEEDASEAEGEKDGLMR